MHFTTLYILQNEELENVDLSQIMGDFGDRFCYHCGETRPRYRYWCDWFQIGGRWCDIIKANKGINGDPSWAIKDDYKPKKGIYSIAEIKDLKEPISDEWIYAIATKSRIYEKQEGGGKFKSLLDKINNKQIKGVIALIDCHD